MLNRAARYFPLLEELHAESGAGIRILEIGSGSIGLGQFYKGSFVGCDVTFSTKPRMPLVPVVASAAALPFSSQSFAIVISSDVMEHVPPQDRPKLISEALRVARNKAIFCFPCGEQALALDRALVDEYRTRGMDPPLWLQEHMQYPFPDGDLFQVVPAGWKIRSEANESLKFHRWLMRKEMFRGWNYLFRIALLTMPGLARRILGYCNDEPCYRRIFILTREENGA